MRVQPNWTIDISVVQQFREQVPEGDRSQAVEDALVEVYDIEPED